MNKPIYKSDQGRNIILSRYQEILDHWPVENKQYLVNTKYGKTFVIESGLSNNPPLLLIHGSVSNSFCWYGDIEALSQKFHVFAIDIIGEAGLSAEVRPTYESGDYPEWIGSVIHELGLYKTAIVGLSLGGWMALSFATKYPHKVSHLILLCSGGLAREKSSFLFKAIFYGLFGKWGKNQIMKMLNGGISIDQTHVDVKKALDFTALISKHFNPRLDKLTLFNEEDLSNLTMPVLALYGDNDCMLNAADSITRLNKHVKHIETVVLQNTGHVITNQTDRIITFIT